MPYWLLKTEPGDYSWDELIEDGETRWDGVRNYQAANNMRAMKAGERAFFYRSIKNPAVLGVMAVSRESYPDPDDEKGKFVCVDLKPLALLPTPVSLKSIKSEPRLANLALVRQSRLSVMPVSDEHWQIICELGKADPATFA